MKRPRCPPLHAQVFLSLIVAECLNAGVPWTAEATWDKAGTRNPGKSRKSGRNYGAIAGTPRSNLVMGPHNCPDAENYERDRTPRIAAGAGR